MATAVPGIALLVVGGISAGSTTGPIAAMFGLVIVIICALIRDRGKNLEPALWDGWGGAPTTQRLRWLTADDPAELADVHRQIADVTNLNLPDRAAEADDHRAADQQYLRAVKKLRALTSDDAKYAHLKTENANYGMRRNLLGLRPVGIAVAAVVFAASIVIALLAGETRYLAVTAVAVVVGVAWTRLETSWVRRQAERYADQLFAALELLHIEQRAS